MQKNKEEFLKIFFSSELLVNDFKNCDHELRKGLFLLYVVVFGVFFCCFFGKLLKRLVLDTPFQNELARVWRDQCSE